MKKKGVVLVCVTPQVSCKRLIDVGAAVARDENAELMIVSAFPKNQSFNPDFNALEALNATAAEYNAEMTVCFSDAPVNSIKGYAMSKDAVMVIMGFPGNDSVGFVSEFHNAMPEMPLGMVDDDGTLYSISQKDSGFTCIYAADKRNLNSLTYTIKI
ncbi:MAG: universal stress protein [Clostridiales bacterium]|nr:universal stress protein [Clostridiales bacterium]